MTVKELQQKLTEFPPETKVVTTCWEGEADDADCHGEVVVGLCTHDWNGRPLREPVVTITYE